MQVDRRDQRSILVVDRQSTIREMLETQLNLTGDFVVSSAACAGEAIQSVMEIKDVDVILMSFSAHTQDNLDELKERLINGFGWADMAA